MEWQTSPSEITLTACEIHVWQVRLDDFQLPYSRQLQNFLTTDEINRANRFHFEKDRRRFTVSRGILRILLGKYLEIYPDQVSLTVTADGKPILADSPVNGALHFNLSHSGAMALFAFSRAARLGIDLEEIRPDVMDNNLADRFFAPGEIAALHALPPPQQIAAFFACWTRKEAYLKGIGLGLNLPLDSFEVSINPGEPGRLLANRFYPDDVFKWRLYEVPPLPGFAATLAAKGENLPVTCRQFSPDTFRQFAKF
jgi:4'-phosphopantetheinyl transferase